MNYIFLDEIQHVPQFEKAVDSLFLKENCDVYITGSNAYFMSGELATVLTGRYVELKMLPLSFREFCTSMENSEALSNAQKFNMYLSQSSFPYLAKYRNTERETNDYLRDIYNSVLLKDIVARLKISDVTTLENVTKFLFHNIGNPVSVAKIVNTLKSQGKGADQKTIGKYLRGLTDSLLLYEAPRYNLKGKMFLTTNSKYYTVDLTLRNMLVRDENVLQRELSPLQKVRDNYPKYLLTLDEAFGTVDYDGIKKLNVLEWLLGS